jgi:TonB family protein
VDRQLTVRCITRYFANVMEQQLPRFSPTPEDHSGASTSARVSGSTPTLPARPALTIVALSEDPVLLEAITNAALDWGSVIASPSPDRLVDQLVASGAELALIDSAVSPAALADFLDSLHRQFPRLQILVAGPGTVQHQIATQISDGTVFRFAHKPASAQRLKLFVDAALRQQQARIAEEILATPVSPGAAAPSAASLRVGGPQDSNGRPRLIGTSIVAALVVVLSAALIWYFSRSASITTAKTSVGSVPSSIAEKAAHRAPAPPVGAPNTGSPASPLAAQRAAEQEAIDRAAAERSEHSERDRIAAVNEARASAAAAEQVQRAAELRSNQIRQYVRLAQQRIASGALLEPADDSARTYVSAALDAAPDQQDVRAVSIALGDALTGSFRQALNAGDRVAAARWLQACRDYQISDATLTQMSVQLGAFESAQLAEVTASRVLSAIPNEAFSEATASAAMPSQPVPASPATAAVAGIIQESNLHRLHFVSPSYPSEALRRGETGTVEMDFTVTPEGKVKDIKVTRSEPAGVFDGASVSALSRSRYEPVEQNGVPIEQRSHIRMRFAL